MSKRIILSIATILFALVPEIQAQVVKNTPGQARGRKADKGTTSLSTRQQEFYQVEEPHDADLQWMKIVYRELDLTKGKNPALYYPDEPNADGQNLFFIIMRQLAEGTIPAYEYLDGKEMFTDQYRIKVQEMLDRFHILYAQAKGSTEKAPRFTIEDADIPSNEVLSYYVIEKWEFDTRTNKMRARIDALCPVLHRQDEFGGEPIKYPMFWVKLNDIRPHIAQQYVFTDDDNNLMRYNLDDFFKLNMYSGDIIKVKNLRNLSLAQMYPDEQQRKQAQDSIENRLRRFDKSLWVPSREELQAQAKAKQKNAATEVSGDSSEDNDTDEVATETSTEKTKSVRKAKNKRASKSSSSKSSRSSVKKSKQPKQPKVKQRSSSGNNGAVRSVRNRKR